MDVEGALLQALYECPDDDASWLVMSDYLEEQGHLDRAELVRLTLALRRRVRGPGRKAQERRLVESVLWDDAVAFCKKLSEVPAEKKAGHTYRLPTEAEWEYACRAGTQSPFHWGDSLGATQANFEGNSPYGGAPKGAYLARPVP